jgi:hypothetical protein
MLAVKGDFPRHIHGSQAFTLGATTRQPSAPRPPSVPGLAERATDAASFPQERPHLTAEILPFSEIGAWSSSTLHSGEHGNQCGYLRHAMSLHELAAAGLPSPSTNMTNRECCYISAKLLAGVVHQCFLSSDRFGRNLATTIAHTWPCVFRVRVWVPIAVFWCWCLRAADIAYACGPEIWFRVWHLGVPDGDSGRPPA